MLLSAQLQETRIPSSKSFDTSIRENQQASVQLKGTLPALLEVCNVFQGDS